MAKKTTLSDIWKRYPFGPITLANRAEVNLIVVYWMFIGKPVAKWQAEYVLQALEHLTGEHYMLDTVDVVLFPEQEGEN